MLTLWIKAIDTLPATVVQFLSFSKSDNSFRISMSSQIRALTQRQLIKINTHVEISAIRLTLSDQRIFPKNCVASVFFLFAKNFFFWSVLCILFLYVVVVVCMFWCYLTAYRCSRRLKHAHRNFHTILPRESKTVRCITQNRVLCRFIFIWCLVHCLPFIFCCCWLLVYWSAWRAVYIWYTLTIHTTTSSSRKHNLFSLFTSTYPSTANCSVSITESNV